MTLCFTYTDDNDDHKSGALDGWAIISYAIGAIEVGILTCQQVDTSNLQFNWIDDFAWMSKIWTFSMRHK